MMSQINPFSNLRPFFYRCAQQVLRVIPRTLLSPFYLFMRDGYNSILFRELDLDYSSVVLDFGGYTGEFTAALIDRFDPTIHVFEPIDKYSGHLRSRFQLNQKIEIHGFGIGLNEGSRTFFESTDSTGSFAKGTPVHVNFQNAKFLHTIRPPESDIALIAMNIEGGEYELIEALDQAGLLVVTKELLIQFHDISTD